MKDKEKQIEEMANIVCKMACHITCKECISYKEDRCVLKDCVDIIYEQGYRKLPENARVFIPDGQMVLLSKEEIEEEIDCAKCVMIRYDSDGTKCVSYDAYKEYTDRLGDNIKKLMAKIKLLEEEHKQASKETAEKFLQLAYDRCLEKSFIKKVEELAKSLGAEIKE